MPSPSHADRLFRPTCKSRRAIARGASQTMDRESKRATIKWTADSVCANRKASLNFAQEPTSGCPRRGLHYSMRSLRQVNQLRRRGLNFLLLLRRGVHHLLYDIRVLRSNVEPFSRIMTEMEEQRRIVRFRFV